MMALATHQLQGSSSSLPSASPSWRRGSNGKHLLPIFLPVGGKNRLISLKCTSCSSVGSSPYLGPKSKILKISAFKGGSRHDDSGGRSNGSKSAKHPPKVSYLQHESEESSGESSKAQNVVPAPYTAADEKTTRSLAIQNLFKNWLMLLRTPPQTPPVEGPAEEEPSSIETSEVPNIAPKQQRAEILRVIWGYVMGLDATMKIPLLVFTPLYFAVNLVYGPEVSKELTPLWILGPVVVALYVKMVGSVCDFYISIFKKSFHAVTNWILLAHEYIIGGKLKDIILTRVWKPLVYLKNMDYKEFRRRKMQEWRERLEERYLEFIESIWPYYCRLIRFLKQANMI